MQENCLVMYYLFRCITFSYYHNLEPLLHENGKQQFHRTRYWKFQHIQKVQSLKIITVPEQPLPTNFLMELICVFFDRL